MAGKFFAGLAWSGLVAGAGLVVISPMAPLVGSNMPATAVQTAAPQEAVPETTAPVEGANQAPAAPETVVVRPATLVLPDETAGAQTTLTPDLPDPVAEQDAILLPTTPEATVETVPGAVAEVVVEAAPEAVAEVVSEAVSEVVPEVATKAASDAVVEVAPKAAAELAPELATETGPMATADNPPDDNAPEAPKTAPPLEVAAPRPETNGPRPRPAKTALAEPAPEEVPVATEPDNAPAEVTPPDPAPETQIAAADTVDPAAGVTTNRLPAIGKSDGAAADNSNASPLVRYARPFENTTGNPPFAILLIDDGSEGVDRAALASLPFAVTFVLDPLAPNTPDIAGIYRAAGQEVAVLATGIPKGATASDLEQTFQAYDVALPEAVAYVDLDKNGFQGFRLLATEVVTTLAPRGRGLLTYDQGLNAADQVAQRADMAHAVIFRALDSEDESTPVVRRYLDRAAFKAAQEGSAIVIGRARPETVAAVVEWALEGRSSSVSIAPVSVILQADR